jgi:hypothetical protein
MEYSEKDDKYSQWKWVWKKLTIAIYLMKGLSVIRDGYNLTNLKFKLIPSKEVVYVRKKYLLMN